MSTRGDVAVILSVLAATVHAWLAPSHLAHDALLGAGFVAAAVAQTAWALAARARLSSRPVVVAGLAINAALVAAWALHRTLGLPGAGTPEPVGVLDVLTVGAELSLCGLLLGSDRARQAGVVVAAALACVLASGMGAH